MKQLQLVEVIWLDATSKYETTERGIKQKNEIAVGRTTTVGYVLKNNLDLISLCQSIFFAPRPKHELELYRHIQTVPKACVLEIHEYERK